MGIRVLQAECSLGSVVFHVRGLGPAFMRLGHTKDLELRDLGVLGKGAVILRLCVMGPQGRVEE